MRAVILAGVFLTMSADVRAQKKSRRPTSRRTPASASSELDKLRKQYIEATKEYKTSLEKLLLLYQKSVAKADERLAKSKQLFAEGLISKNQLTESEEALANAQLKVTEVQQQMASADSQIAEALLEVEGEKQLAKFGPIRKGSLLRTTSFIRYNGAGGWSLSQAGKIQTFFQQAFNRPLPIAVFGQGPIHNQWRLDHRNAMDVSLNPDGAEGQALISFLQSNGIPFSAFRTAIPGVATGPHIHIGMPSHRY